MLRQTWRTTLVESDPKDKLQVGVHSQKCSVIIIGNSVRPVLFMGGKGGRVFVFVCSVDSSSYEGVKETAFGYTTVAFPDLHIKNLRGRFHLRKDCSLGLSTHPPTHPPSHPPRFIVSWVPHVSEFVGLPTSQFVGLPTSQFVGFPTSLSSLGSPRFSLLGSPRLNGR